MTMRAATALALILLAMVAGCIAQEEPALPDADGDDLPDAVERRGWNVTVFHETIPCPPSGDAWPRANVTYHVEGNVHIKDNDSDGLTDQGEFAFGTDPNKPDTDGDGLTDGDEWILRQDTESYHNAAVLSGGDVDSDQDCLTDYEEVIEGFFVEPLRRVVHSDPTAVDGDRDGWADWQEIMIHGTDPMEADTDGDGARDPLDLDPQRNVSIAFRATEVRVDATDVDRVAFEGNAADFTIQSGPFAVTQGSWSPVPEDAVANPMDVQDLTASPTFDVNLGWFQADEDGRIVRVLDVSPADDLTAQIRVHASNETWRILEGDSYSEPTNTCKLEGPDGAFRFDLRIGSAGEDPETWPSLCASP